MSDETRMQASQDAPPAPWWLTMAWVLIFGVAFSDLMVGLLRMG